MATRRYSVTLNKNYSDVAGAAITRNNRESVNAFLLNVQDK